MWDFDYTKADDIKALLYENGLSMQKKFGQNFLINPNFIEKITEVVCKNLDSAETIWEIGPGLGVLSASFVKRGFRVRAFEIDKGFVDILRRRAFQESEMEIVEGDVLRTLFDQKECPKVLVGNLPYNISSPVIGGIMEKNIATLLPNRMVFLLQKEVAYRLSSKEGTRDFSHLSFVLRLSYQPYVVLKVGRGSFFPSPKVDSALLLLEKKPEVISDAKLKRDIIKTSCIVFSNPRKTIYNNLRQCGIDGSLELLKDLGIDINSRISELSYKDILSLCAKIVEYGKKQ